MPLAGCSIYPKDSVFAADVTHLPARPNSSAILNNIGRSESVRAGFGSKIWLGSRPGIPINIVDSRIAPKVDFVLGKYGDISDQGPFPMPQNAQIEGSPGIAWDQHLLNVDIATCQSYEFFFVTPPDRNLLYRWVAQGAFVFDLTTNDFPDSHAATASGVSMLASIVRYDEVASGRIDHALGFTVPTIKAAEVQWPARSTDGVSTDPTAPPMGTWIRLKPNVDMSRLGPQARVVAEALQAHGAMLVDTGSHSEVTLGGAPDDRWDDADLATLDALTMADFDVIDPSSMQRSPDSWAVRTTG
jgi:hypothetical protein